MQQKDNIIGTTFGIRTITGVTKIENKQGLLYWFKCECGKVGVDTLVGFEKYSCCGCVKPRFFKTAFYTNYIGNLLRRMNACCYSVEHRDYPNYGGRGITVCDRWRGRDRYLNFLLDMGERPSSKYSLDRIDNDKGYSPDNCRWADRGTQLRNKRTSYLITYNGETLNFIDWVEKTGMKANTIRGRIERGWDINDVFEKPINTQFRKKNH